MANGPKTAPIITQNLVLAPRLSAICQRRYAHDMHMMEMIIIPVIIYFLLCIFQIGYLQIEINPRTIHIAIIP